MTLKGTLYNKKGSWIMLYSEVNSPRINEIDVFIPSENFIQEKLGNKSFYDNISFEIMNNNGSKKAVLKLEDVVFSNSMLDEISSKVEPFRFIPNKIYKDKFNRILLQVDNGFTPEEQEIMDLLVEAHNKYIKLESTHPSDLMEWPFYLHGLQRILGQRILRREYPGIFPTFKEPNNEKV